MNTTTIDEPVAEASDYIARATLVGDDETTPIEPTAVTSILATLWDVESAAVVFADRNVTAFLTTGGAFAMPLLAADLACVGTEATQRRRLTIKTTQTNGKVRFQAVRFSIENMLNVP
jgi:hypothetical protein